MILLPLLLACHGDPKDTGTVDRAAGERAPRTSACDDLDPVRCLLPWPSSAFLALDPATATGVRVAVDPTSTLVEDDPGFVNLADGFSRISGVATAFEARLDPATAAANLRLFVAEPGDDWGREIPLQVEIVDDGGVDFPKQLVLGRPLEPMPAASEMAVFVMDGLLDENGASLPISETFATDPYFAPERTLGLDPAHVVRAWDFVTRSADDPRKRLDAMGVAAREAVADGSATVVLDSVELRDDGIIAAVVIGHLAGIPTFLDVDGRWILDEAGLPVAQGVADVPFRVVIPDGEGSWRPLMYGHGTGGALTDDAFDTDLAAWGYGKVNLQFDGWTADTFLYTLADFTHWFEGTATSTGRLASSLAGGLAVLDALDGPLADALSADLLLDQPNPAAGRRPDTSVPAWIGGSLGGTLGAVFSAASDRVGVGVLNVPGGGWTHFIPGSYTDTAYLHALLQSSYDGELDIALAMLQSQTAWDDVDGTSWMDRSIAEGDVFVMQESMGDPILLNIGTEILSRAEGAVQVDPSLSDLGLDHAPGPLTQTALTQFRVPDTGVYDVHGFAARDTPAGEAAFEQIQAFLSSAWTGTPTITFPDGCALATADGSCDFSGMW